MCPCFTSELFSSLSLHLQITHPAGCMSQFIKFFGEQILVLWKFALLRKRILIFSPPPVGVVCYRGMFPGTSRSPYIVGWKTAETPVGIEGTDIMQVLKTHHNHSSWRYSLACIYLFLTKCFSSGLLGKDIPGAVKHGKIRLLNESAGSRTCDSCGKTDYFQSRIRCSHLRSSGVQKYFKALTIVYRGACGRAG